MAPVAVGSLVIWLLLLVVDPPAAASALSSSRLVHRFSPERAPGSWPQRGSTEYYRVLLGSDLRRQRMRLAHPYSLLFPSEGSQTMSLGNDFGWLHYTWIDIGSPHVSFLVALDTGSDLLWVPCDCVQCAPLSASYYNSLDRDLNEYSPSRSSSSKHISCSHRLCESGPECKNPKQPCPYTIEYYTENTSTSGLLIEDILHLASGSGDAVNTSVQAPVIIGCGMKQSGGYLDGVAPDGLLGLGLKETSVPSFLAGGGLIRNSFSMCFDEDDSGRLFFGDQGPATQQSTPFLTLNGNYTTYVVGIEAVCIGTTCPKGTSLTALVDSGTSFTFLPQEVYQQVADEFDRQVNAAVSSFDGYPWKYCYKSSSKNSTKVPSMKLMFLQNNSFVIHRPVFMIYGIQGVVGFCLAIQPADGKVGTIGQNFMAGQRVVFDRENMKLGWSRSNCDEISNGALSPNRTSASLPTNEQQNPPGGRAVSPAVAGRAPSEPSAASTQSISVHCFRIKLLVLLLILLGLLHNS